MANPQKENGFTPIAHEILEHLSMPGINGSEFRIICVVLRKTYGFQKKKDTIAISQFQKNTTMNRAQAVKTLKSLVCKRILVKDKNTYQFNKNWDEWVVCKRIPSMQKDTSASMQTGIKTSMQKHTHNRYIDKEIDSSNAVALRSENRHKEIVEIIDAFKDINSEYLSWYKNKNQRAAILRLLESKGKEKILRVIEVLPKTNISPFMPVITTPHQLALKWSALQSGMMKKRNEVISKGRGLA